MLKHVIIVYDFAFINGGQAKVAIDSARLLAESGLQVTYFAAVGPIDPKLEHDLIKVKLIGQSDILSEPSKLKAITSGIWNFKAASLLRELISQYDPKTTVLHCHGYAKALSPSIGPVLDECPLPVVYTMHEYFLACPNGGFYDYQRHEICKRKALGISCLTTNCDVRHPAHKIWRTVRQGVTWGPGRMPRKMRDIIYISETQRNAIAPYISPSTRMHYVPNPIVQPAEGPVDATKNEIYLFVGRLNPEKGGLMFAEAARDAKVRAVFVGDGVEAEAIRKVNPDAEILGWQSPEEVALWMRRARALVFPSLWYECQPLVPLEALAQGIPVICGNWSAAAETVVSDYTGVVYQYPTVECLREAILKCRGLIYDPDQDPSGAFTPEAHVQLLLRLYEEIIGSKTSIV